MTEHRAASGEAPKQPNIDSVAWADSRADIYNPEELFVRGLAQPLIIYEETGFGSPIQRAQLSTEPILTRQGNSAIKVQAFIGLNQSIGKATYRSNFMERFMPSHGKVSDDIQVEPEDFRNAYTILDRKYGVMMLAAISSDQGEVQLTNHWLGTTNRGNPFELQAPAAANVDSLDQLRGISRIFMRTMDVAMSLDSPNKEESLARIYRIGERVQPVASIPYKPGIMKSLGGTVIQGADTTGSATPKTAPEKFDFKSREEELGVITGEDRITLDDIGGLHEVKAKLRDVAVSFAHPEIMAKWGAERPQGILLHGEPGTGKTMLVQALANEIGAKLSKVQASDIYNMWLGNSEGKIKEIFKMIRQVSEPTVILFDEFDSIIRTSDSPDPGGAGAARNAVAGIFKQEMNDVAKENPNVLMAATTNKLERIDSALIRAGRFEKIYIPKPDEEGRVQIIAGIITRSIVGQEGSGFNPFDDDINVGVLAVATDGMSGADLAEIFKRIGFRKAMQEARTGSAPQISHEELNAIIQDFRRQG